MSKKNENQNKQETLASTTTSQTTAITTTIGTGSIASNLNMQYGWVCPKCGKVHAPWKDSCNCYLNVPYTPPNTTPINPAPAPDPFNPVPYWKETPQIGDTPGWWQYGPKCGEPILCGNSISSDNTVHESPIYATSRPQTCRAKTCDICDLLNHPELCGIERIAYSSKIDELVNDVNGLKDSVDKKLGG